MEKTPSTETIKILLAEDEASLRTILRKMFLKKGYLVETAPDGEIALNKIRTLPLDVALVDIKMPEKSGFEVLQAARKEKPYLPVILMTAQDTMKNAVEAMKLGAFDYINKPFELDELEVIVDRALETRRLSEEVQMLRKEVAAQKFDRQAKIIGQSRAVREIYKLIGKVAASDVPVLITGESGTGKELIAKSIHYSSNRANHPFVAVNCAAIPKDLLESELFGTRKGAFTGAEETRPGYFEAAHRGTLFLDEIGDMPLALQSKLLRALQEKEISRLGSTEPISVDVRIISATNQDLHQLVVEKKFREDFFFRLNVVPIRVPPLRERKEDIPILTQHFIDKFVGELSLPPKNLGPDALELLQSHSWPGNVRELENVIKRSMVLTGGAVIKAKDLKNILSENPAALKTEALEELSLEEIVRNKLTRFLERFDRLDSMDLYETILQMVERPLISLVLKKTGGNQIQAARVLGINRNTLRKMIRTLKIPVERSSEEKP
jgi:two-component system, NtrC family, nitrogen regulation response regulator GlnG